MRNCRICGRPLSAVLDFGRMPLADAFLPADRIASEFFYDLHVAMCEGCGLVQLRDDIARERMFHEGYAFFSSTSKRMVRHFEEFARAILDKLDRKNPFVVEIGSNDGSMLAEFERAGVRHLGVDPSANVVQAARERGLRSVCEFFEKASAERIFASDGAADAIVAANCMCHIPYIDSVLEGVKRLLAPDGLFVFEDPYLGNILGAGAFDQFYDEHALYFSVTSVHNMMQARDLELVDIEHQSVHGGSMRYHVAHVGRRPRSPVVEGALNHERESGLTRATAFADLRSRVGRVRTELPALLRQLKSSGKRVVGYAATAKSATVINYCGLTPEDLPWISDTTPGKHGLLSPGAHIPVRPYEDFVREKPDYALLFAWNHAAEIFEKEKAFLDGGGRFILYVPEVKIVNASGAAPR